MNGYLTGSFNGTGRHGKIIAIGKAKEKAGAFRVTNLMGNKKNKS